MLVLRKDNKHMVTLMHIEPSKLKKLFKADDYTIITETIGMDVNDKFKVYTKILDMTKNKRDLKANNFGDDHWFISTEFEVHDLIDQALMIIN